MGNESSQNSCQSLKQLKRYEQVSKTEEGVIYRLRKRNQEQEQYQYFLLKQHNYHNESIYQQAFKKYQQQIEINKSEDFQSSTLHIKEAVKQQIQHFCSNTYKIYTLYQYPELTLKDQIRVREKQKKYFEQSELIAILQTCVLALQQIRSIISFNSKSIFISPDGVIKVLHNDLVEQNYRHLIIPNTYYAPQKLTNFTLQSTSEISLMKQVIFSIGMTLLQACCLNQLICVYDYSSQKINQSKLQNKILEIGYRYSTDLTQLISNMLQINPNRRISILQVQRALNKYEQNEVQDEIQEIQNQENFENNQIEKRCDQFFHKKGPSLEKIKQSTESSDEPSVPNLLSHQNSSRISMTKHQDNFISNDEFYYKLGNNKMNNVNNENHQLKNQTANFASNYSTKKGNQNLFTDPKLLDMIRKDLQEISKSRTSRMVANEQTYNSRVHNSYQSVLKSHQVASHNQHLQKSQQQNNQFQHYYQPNNQFIILKNCPQVQSLAASVVDENSSKKIYVYEQSSVKNQPFLNIKESTVLSANKFNQLSNSRSIAKQQNLKTVRYPLRQFSSNQLSHNSLSHVEDQVKKEMMKKKEGNLIYLQQIYEDGVKYEGMSKNGLKEGYGKMIYADGAYYEGYFHEDKINGKGILYYEKGKPAYDGEWLDEQFNGYGELYNEEPQELEQQFPYHNFNFLQSYWIKYEGEFSQDNKHGHGKITLTSDQFIEGEFKDDMLNGRGKFYKLDGSWIEGRWENNILVQLNN